MQQTSSLVVADTPFRIPITSDEAFAHPQWKQARAALLAISARGEAAVLLGLPGSGKTLLLHDLAHTLRHGGASVRHVTRSDALVPARTADILLVDDAEFLKADVLAALCATGAPLVLAAQPNFADRLAGLSLSVAPVTLDPLPPQEVARFVAARLLASGQPRGILEPEAVLALARHSGGLLRLVNTLGAAATVLARLEGSPRVCQRHVEAAAAICDGIGEDALPAAPAGAETARALTTRMEGAQAARASHPAWQQRRAVLAAAIVALGLALAGGWAFRDRKLGQPSKTQASDGAPVAAGYRTVEGAPLAEAPSVEGGPAAGMPGNDANVELPRPESNHDPGDQATRLGVVHPPRPPATLQRGAQAVRPSVDAAIEPRRTVQPPDAPVSFRGPIINETMGRLGRVSLVIRKQDAPGSIIVRFDASAGLLGSGELTGRLSGDGRITASGQLMMGSNPFNCDLSGVISGGVLTGSARFFRSSSGYTAHSRFTLARS